MTTPPYIPRRRELQFPRLDTEDRPDPADLAEQRRAAGTHRNRRAKPRTTTPKGRQKMTDRCPDCQTADDSVQFSLAAPGVWVLESAAHTPPKPREPCPRCGTNPATG